ncbi:hypothetical protein CBS101457_002696 [Exobasidium rhododendri]|nr:hypothetical protein CBS101457_002696 [Exobasidium rhododendri]
MAAAGMPIVGIKLDVEGVIVPTCIMLTRLVSPSRALQHVSLTRLSLEGCTRRGFASTSSTKKDAAAASTSTVGEQNPTSDTPSKSSTSGPSVPSSCPAGTVLSGLSLYKDRADPVALPDSEYPAWLWNILDDPSATSASGAILESTAGLSKGEARVVQKRNVKAVRAASRGKGKGPAGPGLAGGSGAGAGMNATGPISEGDVDVSGAGEAEMAHGAAATVVGKADRKSAAEEAEAKKALRRASREKIKAKNFIVAR